MSGWLKNKSHLHQNPLLKNRAFLNSKLSLKEVFETINRFTLILQIDQHRLLLRNVSCDIQSEEFIKKKESHIITFNSKTKHSHTAVTQWS